MRVTQKCDYWLGINGVEIVVSLFEVSIVDTEYYRDYCFQINQDE